MRQQQQDQYDRQCEELIQRFGWMVQGVGAGEGEPTFSYTVGLHQKHRPEVIVFGLPLQVAQPILNDVAGRVSHIGDGTRLNDVLSGYPVEFVEVIDGTGHLTMANRLARQHGFPTPVPALQLCWPDPDSRFQWEPGFRIDGIPLLGMRP